MIKLLKKRLADEKANASPRRRAMTGKEPSTARRRPSEQSTRCRVRLLKKHKVAVLNEAFNTTLFRLLSEHICSKESLRVPRATTVIANEGPRRTTGQDSRMRGWRWWSTNGMESRRSQWRRKTRSNRSGKRRKRTSANTCQRKTRQRRTKATN